MKESSNPLLSGLNERLLAEPFHLSDAKKAGLKVIGYTCSYVPEELILAADMIPLRLAFGGEVEPAIAGAQFLKAYSCPAARSCLGYVAAGSNELWKMADAVCVVRTCENTRQIQDYFEETLNVPTFKIGLPHTHDSLRSRPQALEYFRKELVLFKEHLEEFGGHSIKSRDIRRAIGLTNEIRRTLRLFFDFPKQDNPPLEWRDAFFINQAGFIIDRKSTLVRYER
jgi:benzoyl-CoA reductase subunit C